MMKIRANQIQSETIPAAITELRQDLQLVEQLKSQGFAVYDALEAIATHIIMTDTDCELCAYPNND